MSQVPASAAAPSSEGGILRVVDGDTIVALLDDSEERVRFLNIDTPEVGTCMADQATAFTTRELPAGREVELRYDRDLRDSYGRVLALVKPPGGQWLSVSLAERGLGFPMSISPNDSYYGRVVDAADRAKRDRAGMFSPRRSCTPVARAERANDMVSQAQSMPVRTRAQYDAANRKLNQALALIASVSVARYGFTSSYFVSYASALRGPVIRRASLVRASKARQWNIVRNTSQDSNGGNGNSNTNGNGGWWPPGVSHSYTGPRCYEPGGVIWYPC